MLVVLANSRLFVTLVALALLMAGCSRHRSFPPVPAPPPPPPPHVSAAPPTEIPAPQAAPRPGVQAIAPQPAPASPQHLAQATPPAKPLTPPSPAAPPPAATSLDWPQLRQQVAASAQLAPEARRKLSGQLDRLTAQTAQTATTQNAPSAKQQRALRKEFDATIAQLVRTLNNRDPALAQRVIASQNHLWASLARARKPAG